MAEGIVLGPGEGEALRRPGGGRVAVVKAGLPDLTVLEFTIEGPFDGPEPHTHADHTDSFYVLEGHLDFYVEGEWITAGPGTWVAAPRGVEHGFTKREPGTARFLNIHAPGGFEVGLREASEQVDARARWDALADDVLARHGDCERSHMMSMPCVKRNGKIAFGFWPREDAAVFKLPDPIAHGEALKLKGAHLFDPGGNGRPFREWVVVPAEHAAEWPGFAERTLA